MKQKLITGIAVFLFGLLGVSAQQDPQYTQYMYNTQVVNPGYAGSKEVLSFGALMRSQWVGLDGAPKTGTFSGTNMSQSTSYYSRNVRPDH